MPRVTGTVWRAVAAAALVVTMIGGLWQYGPTVVAFASSAGATEVGRDNRAPAPAPRVGPASTVQSGVQVAEHRGGAASVPAAGGDSLQTGTGEGPAATVAQARAGAYEDRDIVWTPAVARTWVNVRSDASRGGQVVGVIKPAARAMLGTDKGGWRLVRSPDVTGWADPRLFAPAGDM